MLRELRDLDTLLHHWPLQFSGTEGYPKPKSLLAALRPVNFPQDPGIAKRSRPFLYWEVADVTGWLGGYNFQWAWASGYAAGLVA